MAMSKKRKTGPPKINPFEDKKTKRMWGKPMVTFFEQQSFTNLRNWLINRCETFEIRHQGSVQFLIYKGKVYQYLDIPSFSGRGHHLSTMVRKDVDAFRRRKRGRLKPYAHDYKEQMFNIEAIKNVIGIPMISIDINDCYWKTAFLLGYISEKTFISGRPGDKRWKIGRNASIGGLTQRMVSYKYVHGKLKLNTRKVRQKTKREIDYDNIRNHIIGHIYRMFRRLFDILGNDFFMFMTDCVVTTPERMREAEKFIRDQGYKCKHKVVEFTEVDTTNKIIRWFDFEAKTVNGKDRRKKYYSYADHQVVQSAGFSKEALADGRYELWMREQDQRRYLQNRDFLKIQNDPDTIPNIQQK